MLLQVKETKDFLVNDCKIARKGLSVKMNYWKRWIVLDNGRKYRDYKDVSISITGSYQKYRCAYYVSKIIKKLNVTIITRDNKVITMLIFDTYNDKGKLTIRSMEEMQEQDDKIRAMLAE